jgi:Adenylate cyclase, family 3 (some proteins contain HAMP domain)
MFTDQVDFTGNTALRTPDEIGIVTREQNELTTEAVSRCRGLMLNDTGDGHMIEFRACSDAVRCGSLIQKYVAERNQSQSNERLKFELHIGIEFGEAVLISEGGLHANAANLAARITAQGPKGEVYFTEKVKNELNPREASVEQVGRLPLKGVVGEVSIYRLIEWLGPVESTPNPFIWRDGITRAEDFFGRESELRRLRDLLRGRQNCQIVGPRRIGKTSLLRQVEHQAATWDSATVVAYVDQQDASCNTRQGWLKHVGKKWHWKTDVSDLAEFSEQLDEMLTQKLRPVLCMDEFEEMTARPKEFPHDFFVALRACGQKGLSIITTSKKPLSQLTDPQDSSSPYFNTFSLLPLGVLTNEEAEDFVNTYRPGVQLFTPDEKKRILKFAKRHPLALQVACYYAIEAKDRESISAALHKASDEMKAILPQGW